MIYRDLIQFEPIETVVQLRDADHESAAHRLVATYVVSTEMAEKLAVVLIPQLQFDEPADNKGFLVVGNYGTGKSHLMSVISAVAERGELLDALTNEDLVAAARRIAGRFKVARNTVRHTLRSCAAAMDLASRASGHAKEAYDSRARSFLQDLTKWLQERMRTAFEVTYRGMTKPLMGWIKHTSTGTGARANVSQMVNAASSVALAAHFENEAPQYPAFADYHTAKSQPQAVRDALRWIAGSRKTQQAARVLDALELLDGDRLDPTPSKYAGHIVESLRKKGVGQVLNRAELIDTVQDVEYLALATFRLEPEWVVVLLASLVHSGEVVLAVPGKKLDATAVEILAATPVDELANFKHVERPKEWNIPALSAVFEALGLTPGMARLVTQGKDAPVQELQKAVTSFVTQVVTAQQAIREGLHFWGRKPDGRADRPQSAHQTGYIEGVP